MRFKHDLSALAVALMSLCLAGPAGAQIGLDAEDSDSILEWWERGGRFYLRGEHEVEVIDFGSKRNVRVCADLQKSDVTLLVTYGETEAIVQPGDCSLFEARRIEITPAGELPAAVELSGTIETRS